MSEITETSQLRALVSDAIGAMDGWTVSRFSPDLFGRDTAHLMNRAYVVSIPASEIHPRDGRQRPAEGLIVTSSVEVTWAHQLRNDGQDEDYTAMLDAEQALVSAVRRIEAAGVLFQRSTRRAVAEGWILVTTSFSALHRYALPTP